ncbi:MAG: hypothetical protein J0I20_15930 [Chloroflexi bacterium]|nr:hypothetical protein [Chloroflexota bacterium]OJV91214.1 MAG: hypothetical protein BGO39_26540 [Chloroflexi bacterium 54-19]
MLKNAGPNFWEAAGNITFTAIPNNFLDNIAPTLNPSELRVMLYIYRHTLGFQKLTDTISYDQFLNGQVTHNNRSLDKGAGISRNSLVAALASLENKALIRRQHNGKYGPVTIKLQPSALSDSAESTPAKTSVARKETRNLAEGATRAKPAKAVTDQTGKAEVSGPAEDQKLDRPIDSEGFHITGQAQVLTENEVCETQKLVFTKETKTQKQNKPVQTVGAQIAQGSQLITTNIPGISTTDANRLAEQAFANGRDQAYISRLVRHVTGNPAIRVPAAVLTTLVRSNEDRLTPDSSTTPGNSSKRQFVPGLSAKKSLKPAQQSAYPSSGKKIDFSKYGPLSPALSVEAPDVLPEPSGRSSVSGAESPAQPHSGNLIDAHLKYSLQEFDSRLAVYVRHLVVEGSLLKIGFFGAKHPHETELADWLSSVKIYYPEVRAIQVMEQLF